MARIIYLAAAGITVCASAAVAVIERGIELAFNLIMGIVSPEAPAFALTSDLVPAAGPAIYADPHVERHEAHTSHRAAARGI